MNYLARYFPWLVILAASGYIAWTLVPPRDEDGQFRFTEAARVPVVKDGRIKPLDTLARNSLLVISNRQSVVDEDGKKVPLMKWLLDVMTSGDGYEHRKEFRITGLAVLRALHLEKTPDSHYSLADIRDASPLFVEMVLNSGRLDDDKSQQVFYAWFIRQVLGMEDFDLEKAKKQLAEPSMREAFYGTQALGVDIQRFVGLKRFTTPYRVFRIENDQVLGLLQLKPRSGWRYTFDELYPGLPDLFNQVKRVGPIKEKDRDLYSQKLMELYERLQLYVGLARLEAPTLRLIPPLAGEVEDEWRTVVKAREREDRLHMRFLAVASSAVGGPASPSLEQKRSRHFYPALQDFEILLTTYQKGDVPAFNRQLLSYRKLLEKQMPDKVAKADFETRFNQFDPFYHCALFCFGVFLLACFAWLGWSDPLNRAAFGLATLVFGVLGVSLVVRMYLMDRPWVFVTNLYSSAVFIGEACIAFGLILEKIYRNGIGNAIAGLVGFLALILAPQLVSPAEVDTMGNLRAVLDTNFWLATHVTCVSLGYMSTFLAGFLGMIFILRGLFTCSLDRQALKTMGQMIYGVLCFALLFSFTGTVLGGIWADQSWGRFWGWDPKENGALLIVLMNALILHARWAGLVQQRGMAVLAVIGNMVTAWSWFGTNQLGVGLHAYGFNNTLSTILVVFWSVMAGFLVLGILPRHLWRSFAK